MYCVVSMIGELPFTFYLYYNIVILNIVGVKKYNAADIFMTSQPYRRRKQILINLQKKYSEENSLHLNNISYNTFLLGLQLS